MDQKKIKNLTVKADAPPTAGLNGMDELVGDGGEGNVGGEGEDRHRAEPLAQAPLRRLTHRFNFNRLWGQRGE
jgi:hypothetical protein